MDFSQDLIQKPQLFPWKRKSDTGSAKRGTSSWTFIKGNLDGKTKQNRTTVFHWGKVPLCRVWARLFCPLFKANYLHLPTILGKKVMLSGCPHKQLLFRAFFCHHCSNSIGNNTSTPFPWTPLCLWSPCEKGKGKTSPRQGEPLPRLDATPGEGDWLDCIPQRSAPKAAA